MSVALGSRGDANLINSGTITATSTNGNAYGAGSFSVGSGHADVASSGSITAMATDAKAYGAFAASLGGGHVNVTNSGSITAMATDATPGNPYVYGGAFGVLAQGFSGDASVTNTASGSITAIATGDVLHNAAAAGIYALGYNASVYNGGAVAATATGPHGSEATGVVVHGYTHGHADFSAGATSAISATATADPLLGSASANGVHVYGSQASVTTAAGSSIRAIASAYTANTTGLSATGANTLTLVNGGDIAAKATGAYGSTTGLFGDNTYAGGGTFTASNSGNITAAFNGAHGHAYGTLLESAHGDVVFTNTGRITATQVGSAYSSVGAYLEAGASHTTALQNSGTISGDIAVLSGASTDTIVNSGILNGAIVTGAGNDTLYNRAGGVWNPGSNVSSDFGTGDDAILNAGTIHLTDSTIGLGGFVVGNHFVNASTGLIQVSGGHNTIGMDNPFPFVNNGTISFLDGAPNDVLTINGDFDGDGRINVDVSAAHSTGDLLAIEGSIAPTGANTINVALLDMPTTASTTIPVVTVDGNSVAGNFKLGTVDYSLANFLTLDFNLIGTMDATHTTDGVFSLGIAVSGLSDPGTLGASIASGAQSLMNSEIGTWRQRMGAIEKLDGHTLSLWARVFDDKGSVDPGHVASNFGQGGNFDFNQENSGVEAGLDFAVGDAFDLGLLLGQADGSQHLTGAGVGTSQFNGNTYGIYVTWITPQGFYLDGAYRRMNFHDRLNSIAGAMKVHGDASAFNLEGGYAWTLASGLNIEPQAQYTNTRVEKIGALVSPLATFVPNGGTSSRGRLGVSFRQSFGDAGHGTVWTPYATISAVREFDGKNTYSVGNHFFGETSTRGTSALLELGLTAQTGNLSVFGGVNWEDGGALKSFFGGQLGARYTFGRAPEPVKPAPPPPKS